MVEQATAASGAMTKGGTDYNFLSFEWDILMLLLLQLSLVQRLFERLRCTSLWPASLWKPNLFFASLPQKNMNEYMPDVRTSMTITTHWNLDESVCRLKPNECFFSWTKMFGLFCSRYFYLLVKYDSCVPSGCFREVISTKQNDQLPCRSQLTEVQRYHQHHRQILLRHI